MKTIGIIGFGIVSRVIIELGIKPTVLEAVWKKNLEVRKKKDWLKIKGAVSS